MTVQELKEVLEQRFERLETDLKEIRDDMRDLRNKLDQALELLNYQRGQQEFSARFWKHAAWVVPTSIALVALIKTFL